VILHYGVEVGKVLGSLNLLLCGKNFIKSHGHGNSDFQLGWPNMGVNGFNKANDTGSGKVSFLNRGGNFILGVEN